MELSEEEKKVIKKIKKILYMFPESEELKLLLNLLEKQQKEIKDWFEIADNILRATNDYGNIAIGDIPKYIKKQQKEIEELRKDKKDNIQVVYGGRRFGTEGMVVKDFISKDKIRELIEKYEQDYERQDKKELFNLKKITAGKLSALNELLEENTNE